MNTRLKKRTQGLKALITWGVFCLLIITVLGTMEALASQKKLVQLIPVREAIGSGLATYIEDSLREAGEAGADAVILEINTFGGRLDASIRVRDAMLNCPVRTIAFINKRAISAGALISLSAETIVMVPGATIGAATPVNFLGEKASEKVISYWRAEMRATAEKNHRPVKIAEAMVDEDVFIRNLTQKGKLVTLTTAEALKYKVADFQAEDIKGVLQQTGLAGARVTKSTVEREGWLGPAWMWWVLLAAACVVIEIFTAGFFVLWFGVGAAAAAVVAWMELSGTWQGVTFVVVSGVCVALSRPFAKRIMKEEGIKVGPDRLLEKEGIVLENIDMDAGSGKVRVENEEWRAISEEGEIIEAGAKIQVLRIEGTHLIVILKEG
jgi:membrane-bound ClpP family serine protease